jgi:hypothetical protein
MIRRVPDEMYALTLHNPGSGKRSKILDEWSHLGDYRRIQAANTL